jgi:hypothetical protein
MKEHKGFACTISSNDDSQNNNTNKRNCEDHSNTRFVVHQRQSYYSAIGSPLTPHVSKNDFIFSLSHLEDLSTGGTSILEMGKSKTSHLKDHGKRNNYNYTKAMFRPIQKSYVETNNTALILSPRQRHFNVVFIWEDLEYKLLNVYHIEYFKCFEYLVECALYEASICIANRHCLQETINDVLAIDDSYEKSDDGGGERNLPELTNNRHKRRVFRKSMRELSLEVIDFSNIREFKHWRHIEIRIANELYHREEVFWKTMDLINQMQTLRTYCLS